METRDVYKIINDQVSIYAKNKKNKEISYPGSVI